MLAIEKESIGLFISAHPLKALSVAMSTKTDVNLGGVSACRDGDRVTVGGIISQVKKLKTKKGDPMVFATLEDLDGSVELVIFADTLEQAGSAVEPDAVVLVKGKIDHKEASRTCVVVSSVDRSSPLTPSLPEPSSRRRRWSCLSRSRFVSTRDAVQLDLIDDLRELLASFPGDAEVVVELALAQGARRLRLGSTFRVQRTAGLYSELSQARSGSGAGCPSPTQPSAA